jgi:hypothetical protein
MPWTFYNAIGENELKLSWSHLGPRSRRLPAWIWLIFHCGRNFCMKSSTLQNNSTKLIVRFLRWWTDVFSFNSYSTSSEVALLIQNSRYFTIDTNCIGRYNSLCSIVSSYKWF